MESGIEKVSKMKSLSWQGLLSLVAIPHVTLFLVRGERAASVSSPADIPALSDIIDHVKGAPGGVCVS